MLFVDFHKACSELKLLNENLQKNGNYVLTWSLLDENYSNRAHPTADSTSVPTLFEKFF